MTSAQKTIIRAPGYIRSSVCSDFYFKHDLVPGGGGGGEIPGYPPPPSVSYPTHTHTHTHTHTQTHTHLYLVPCVPKVYYQLKGKKFI